MRWALRAPVDKRKTFGLNKIRHDIVRHSKFWIHSSTPCVEQKLWNEWLAGCWFLCHSCWILNVFLSIWEENCDDYRAASEELQLPEAIIMVQLQWKSPWNCSHCLRLDFHLPAFEAYREANGQPLITLFRPSRHFIWFYSWNMIKGVQNDERTEKNIPFWSTHNSVFIIGKCTICTLTTE